MIRAGVRNGEGGVSLLVDARAILAGGIGRYLREILSRLFCDPRFSDFTLLGSGPRLREFVAQHRPGKEPPFIRMVDFEVDFYSPRLHLVWPLLRRKVDFEVAFFPHYDAPAFGLPPNSVVTIHDLTHFKLPETFPRLRRMAAGVIFDRVCRAAGHLIAVSEATRRDLLARFPEVASKVSVIRNGVSDRFLKGAPPSDGAARSAASLRPYLLSVGNRKPHKNLETAVEVLARVRASRPDLRLVVAGRSYPGWERVVERARALGVEGALVEFEAADDDLLHALYTGAEALLFPSLYEGFGLPALEARACGCPVIASDQGALPEVVGNGGALFDPYDVEGMAGAVERLSTPAAKMKRKGAPPFNCPAKWSWDRTVAELKTQLVRVAAGARGC